MSIHYFTFGSKHVHDGTPLRDRYIKVVAPVGVDTRSVLIGLLGSNAFSSQYSDSEFEEYLRRYPTLEYLTIEVSAPCPRCGRRIPSDEYRGAYPGALSRRGDYEVCSRCGVREALEDFFNG